MNRSLTQLMSNGGDCRTAPATPGLLNIYNLKFVMPLSSIYARALTRALVNVFFSSIQNIDWNT